MRNLLLILAFVTSHCFSQSSSISQTFYFDSGKSDLKLNDKHWLDSISGIIKNSQRYSIDIKTYCDADGSDESNEELAKARANSINSALITNDLKKDFISTNSFGEKDPLEDNSSEQGKAKNRRGLIKIVYEKKIDEPVVSKVKVVSDKTPGNVSNELIASNLEVGKTLILKNLNFEGGTPVLLPESEPTLKELLKLMQENPTLEIEIGGHVCCGPDMALSIARAKKVFTYLVNYGIREKRMSYRGYSFDRPLTQERTSEERTMNRRVEITILKL